MTFSPLKLVLLVALGVLLGSMLVIATIRFNQDPEPCGTIARIEGQC